MIPQVEYILDADGRPLVDFIARFETLAHDWQVIRNRLGIEADLPNPLREGSAADLVFSQGTYCPPEVHDRQGFVLCCGWFRARPTPGARAFLRAVELDARTTRHDQASVNRVLAAAGPRWSRVEADYERTFRDRRFACWTATNHGTATIDGHPLSVALLPHREFQRLPEDHDRIMVRHFLTPSGCAEKLRKLRSLGVLPP